MSYRHELHKVRTGAFLAICLGLVVLLAMAVLLFDRGALVSALVLAPLIAATRLNERQTAIVAGCAASAALVISLSADIGDPVARGVRVGTVVLAGILSVVAVRIRDRLRALEQQARIEERRQAFLARAGMALNETLDVSTTLEQIAQIAVPMLGDACVACYVSSADEARDIRPMAAREVDSAAAMRPTRAKLSDYGRELVTRAASDGGAHGGIRTRGTDANGRDGSSGGLREACLAVPLSSSRNRGGLLITRHDSSFDDADVALAMELSRRASLSLENAVLFERERDIAATLQQSLLPTELPALQGSDVASVFLPATVGTKVGGDSFDLFEDTDQRQVAAIVDVCGKGAPAAAIAGLVRHAIRAYGYKGASPMEILYELNELLLASAAERYCTAAVARFHTNGNGLSVEFSLGGHPPPIRVGPGVDNSTGEVGATGSLIGVEPRPHYRTTNLTLPPTDALVLYTDGVTDAAGHGRRQSTEALIARLGECAGAEAGAIAQCVRDFALAPVDGDSSVLFDDIAALVITPKT